MSLHLSLAVIPMFDQKTAIPPPRPCGQHDRLVQRKARAAKPAPQPRAACRFRQASMARSHPLPERARRYRSSGRTFVVAAAIGSGVQRASPLVASRRESLVQGAKGGIRLWSSSSGETLARIQSARGLAPRERLGSKGQARPLVVVQGAKALMRIQPAYGWSWGVGEHEGA